MSHPEMGGNKPPESEQNELAVEINKRAITASEKVRQRIATTFIPNINLFGSHARHWLLGLQNDFYTLIENPDDESGGGHYTGWTKSQIKELYSVLFGEEMFEDE